jgi:hypothetical protein
MSLGTNILQKFEQLRRSHSALVTPIFFLAGFFFDIFTLDRIDSTLGLIQQGIYLAVICAALISEMMIILGKWQVSDRFAKYWQWHVEIVHFLLGSLLSVYMLLFLLSSSMAVSFWFIAAVTGLLVYNETEVAKKRGVSLRFVLLAVCAFAYVNILVPIWVGFVGTWVFALAMGLLALFFGGILFWLYRRTGNDAAILKLSVKPIAGVMVVFVILYMAKMIPPIPLSLQHLGVYHNVQKEEGRYRLTYNRVWYKFWVTDSSDFAYRPGDKVYVFTRIFSPSEFQDQIFIRWFLKVNGDWKESDRIGVKVSGGRDEGFRATSYKSFVEPGQWRVLVESSDGRELGRKSFNIFKDEEFSTSARVVRSHYQ